MNDIIPLLTRVVMYPSKNIFHRNSSTTTDIQIKPWDQPVSGKDMKCGLKLSLIIMLPGFFRPQLDIGQPGRFEISGYPHTYQPVSLNKIADEVVGPTEARRFLGQEIADAVAVSGSVVLTEANLGGEFFEADGQRYIYADGMQGRVQIRVRSIPIILNLVPGLRYIWEGGNRGFSE